MNEIKNVIKNIGIIKRKYADIEKLTAIDFNFFESIDVSEKEVIICRAIKTLLDKDGKHGQGIKFLKKFFEIVLYRTDVTNDQLQNMKVYKEYNIKEQRRIDIYITDEKEIAIPIEAKVFAGEQKNQCNDYIEYCKDSKLFYLTLDGHMPSEYSLKKENQEKVTLISFNYEIVKWLEACLNDVEVIKINSVREYIIQFLANIRSLCNMVDNKQKKEMKEILNTQEWFEIYEDIQEAMTGIYEDELNSVFGEIINETTIDKSKWESNKYTIQKFCRKSTTDYIEFYCATNRKYNDELELFYGIGYERYRGFYVGIYNKNEDSKNLKSTINVFHAKIFDNKDLSSPSWPYYCYVDEEKNKNINKMLCEIKDNKKRKHLIDSIVGKLNDIIKRINDIK